MKKFKKKCLRATLSMLAVCGFGTFCVPMVWAENADATNLSVLDTVIKNAETNICEYKGSDTVNIVDETDTEGEITGNKIVYVRYMAIGEDSSYGASAIGEYSMAWGVSASANNQYAIAIGNSAKADGRDSISVGSLSYAYGLYSTAYGNSAHAGKQGSGIDDGATAIGYSATASKGGSTAVGHSAVASSGNATALGNAAKATAHDSVALGVSSGANGDYSFALGSNSTASGEGSLAIGWKSKTEVKYAIAIGYDSTVSGLSAIAFGNSASATGNYSLAVGGGASAKHVGAVALGPSSETTEEYTVSVGRLENGSIKGITRRIVNVTAGTSNTDAATYGQLVDAQAVAPEQTGGTTTYTAYTPDDDGIVTVETNNGGTAFKLNLSSLGGDCVVDTGTDDSVSGTNYWLSTDFGKSSSVTHGTNSTAYGYLANAQGDNSVAFGKNAVTGYSYVLGGTSAVAIGNTAKSISDNSIAIGVNTEAGIFDSADTTVKGSSAVAIGDTAKAYGTSSIAIGQNAYVAYLDKSNNALTSSVAIGADAVANESNTVSFGHKKGERTYTADSFARLVNVANGTDNNDVATYGQVVKNTTYTVGNDNKIVVKTNGTDANGSDTAFTLDLSKIAGASSGSYTGSDTITIGTDNSISVRNMAMGTTRDKGATATGLASIALGSYSEATGKFSIALGDEAVAGYSDDVKEEGDLTGATIAIGPAANAIGNYSTAIGYNAYTSAEGYQGVALGRQAWVTGRDGIGIGAFAEAAGAESIAIGYGVEAYGQSAVGLGYRSTASGDKSLALGNGSTAQGVNSVALGSGAFAGEANTVSVGHKKDEIYSYTITYEYTEGGQKYTDSYTAQRAYEVGSKLPTGETVTACEANKYTSDSFARITNVADGTDAHDAATVGQLKEISKKATYTAGDNVTITGNKVSVKTDGKVESGNTGIVTGGTVYDAISKQIADKATYTAGDHVTIANNKVSVKTDGSVTSGDSGIVTGGAVYTAVQNSYVDGKSYTISANNREVTVQNKDGSTAFKLKVEASAGDVYTSGDHINIDNDYKISVKTEGKVESGNTGIVTGGAVYEKTGDTSKLTDAGLSDNLTDSILDVNEKVDNVTNQVVDVVNNSLGTIQNDINKVGAGAAALAALRPEGFSPDDKFSFAVGFGHYKNANAGAFGAFYKPNADTTVSIGSTIGNGDPMMNAGVSFKLGARSKGAGFYSSNTELVREMNAIRKDNEMLRKVNVDQAKEIGSLKADNAQMKAQIAEILQKFALFEKVNKSVVR